MKRRRIDVNLGELDQLLDRAVQAPLSEPDCHKIKTTLHTLVEMLAAKRSTEKTSAVVGAGGGEAALNGAGGGCGEEGQRAWAQPGVGLHRSHQVAVPHPSLQPGDACPECPKGKVYAQKSPGRWCALWDKRRWPPPCITLEELRCNACGQVFTAPEPEGVGPEKYDETALAMVAELKYGSGMPFNRIENLEERLGIPLPAATQWGMVAEAADLLQPVQEELIREAAQGELFHNDDTSVRILKLKRPADDARTCVFTSAVLSVVRQEAGPEGALEEAVERRMALCFSGREHAGENLAKVLQQRAAESSQAMLMSDALSRNAPKLSAGVELLLANCLAHGRRQFVEVAGSFPAECRYVLETLGGVYANNAVAKDEKMTPVARLEFHRQHSQTPMDELENWMRE
jgi:transposase